MSNDLSASKIMQCSTQCGLWEGDFTKIFSASSDIRKCLETCMPSFFTKEVSEVDTDIVSEVIKITKLPTYGLIALSAIATGAVIVYLLRRKR